MNAEPVSTTTRPVTQIALVAVKSASKKPMGSVPECIIGNESSKVDMEIASRKLKATIWAGFSCLKIFTGHHNNINKRYDFTRIQTQLSQKTVSLVML